MRELVDIDYPDIPVVRVVIDNLSTHSAGALYDAFPAPEARRVLKRLQSHHTPKHRSWLNMAEIELGVLRSQCLERRMTTRTPSSPRSPLGNNGATPKALRSRGCSVPRRLAKNSAKPIPSRSHNFCETVLGLQVGTVKADSIFDLKV
jgi:hypothetical protein